MYLVYDRTLPQISNTQRERVRLSLLLSVMTAYRSFYKVLPVRFIPTTSKSPQELYAHRCGVYRLDKGKDLFFVGCPLEYRVEVRLPLPMVPVDASSEFEPLTGVGWLQSAVDGCSPGSSLLSS